MIWVRGSKARPARLACRASWWPRQDDSVSGRGSQIEFKVFLRGRDHSYLVRVLPWTATVNGTNGAAARAGQRTRGSARWCCYRM